MPIKSYNPTTPSRRFMTTTDFSMLTKTKPNKKLLKSQTTKVGRNNKGTITTHHRGGGHKKQYRLIEFKQFNLDRKARIQTIEYDPNRTAFICEVLFENGEKNYILCPEGIKVGDAIMFSKSPVDVKPGNRTILQNIPDGVMIHNIEMQPNKGAAIARSAGSYAKIVSHEGKYTQIQMPSGEIRRILSECFASLGQVSNLDHSNVTIGKAGRVRWMGRRPTVRGKAKNPVDHPHGGGEGNHPVGLKHPKTPWGKPALGKITRKKKLSDKFILRRRKKK